MAVVVGQVSIVMVMLEWKGMVNGLKVWGPGDPAEIDGAPMLYQKKVKGLAAH